MNFRQELDISGKLIGNNHPVFIIAEAGVNHNGSMDTAKKLIDIAKEAGADAVKFQAFKTENLILSNVEKAPYQKEQDDNIESQFRMLKRLEISYNDNLELLNYANSKGIIFLTTPFDEASLNQLDSLNLPAYKVASTDLTNLPFLSLIAKKGKPIFLSTGMSYFSEVETVIKEIALINSQVVLMQCTANYPIEDYEANLAVLNTYRERFGALIGYSDHTEGIGAAPFSIPMGVSVVEKHFTIDKVDSGPDHAASLSPNELKNFVDLIRRVESYIGSNVKKPTLSELKNRQSLQKCLVAKTFIRKGEVITSDSIVAKRTGGRGISPLYCNEIIGRLASKDFDIDDIIEND